jgi:hypothetical protein
MSQHAKKGTQKLAKSSTAIGKKSKGLTDEERAAMKERGDRSVWQSHFPRRETNTLL